MYKNHQIETYLKYKSSNNNLTKINLTLGGMRSGKSKLMFDLIESLQDKSILILNGDGRDFVKTRYNHKKLKTNNFNELKDITHHYDYILLDEFHFLKNHELEDFLLDSIKLSNNIFIYGLEYNWQGESFIRGTILDNNFIEINRLWYLCECCKTKNTNIHYHLKLTGDKSLINEIENNKVRYQTVCDECFKKNSR